MEEKLTLRYKERKVEIKISCENLIYAIRPEDLPGLEDEGESIRESLKNPISSAPLSQQVRRGDESCYRRGRYNPTHGKTHLLPMYKNEILNLVGNTENEVRLEMEKVAEIAKMNFIVNVVLNGRKEIVKVASGDQVKAHRESEGSKESLRVEDT